MYVLIENCCAKTAVTSVTPERGKSIWKNLVVFFVVLLLDVKWNESGEVGLQSCD